MNSMQSRDVMIVTRTVTGQKSKEEKRSEKGHGPSVQITRADGALGGELTGERLEHDVAVIGGESRNFIGNGLGGEDHGGPMYVVRRRMVYRRPDWKGRTNV